MQKIDKKQVLELAVEAGLIFNQEMLPNANQLAYKWHKQRLYAFAELLLKANGSALTENASTEVEKAPTIVENGSALAENAMEVVVDKT